MTPEQVLTELAGGLPPATLVLGPGAGAVVFGACAAQGWAFRFDLNAAAARQVRDEAYLAPVSGQRVIAMTLERASDQVQNMLLKVLEEPPGSTRFVLAAEHRPLPTVASRCRVLVLGRETEAEPADSRDVAAVATVVRAARSGRPVLLAQNLRNWTPVQTRLLTVWAAEALSGQWRVFSPDTVPGAVPDQALRLLTELARYPGAKLGALAALEVVFSPG